MEDDNKIERDGLVNLHRSNAAKIAWKKHRYNYMKANRKKSRDYMNKTFYGIAKELEPYITETVKTKDDVFNLEYNIAFENISGGLSFKINKEDGNISFSTFLSEDSKGNYKIENGGNTEDELKGLYNDLKDEITILASTLENSMKQVLAKHGLRQTY